MLRRSLPLFITALALCAAPAPLRAGEAPFLLQLGRQSPEAVADQAAGALSRPVVTLMNRHRASPVADPHEYVSYATYWWPDPSKPDGKPYLQKDGHHNTKQTDQGDRRYLDQLYANLPSLALGWAVLHREDCALRAGAWIRAWFINPETRMAPNLEYSQVQLGHNHDHGAGTGVLDGRDFAKVVDALRLLHGSPGLPPADEATVKAWFQDYLQWLLTSKNGNYEHVHPNNHGSWFLVQAIAIARYSGREDAARTLAREDYARIDHQFTSDGSQPEELRRQDALGYSVFNISAQLSVVRLTNPLGFDLGHYVSPHGGSIAKGIAYLKPFSDDPQSWKGNAIRKPRRGFLSETLREAAALGMGS